MSAMQLSTAMPAAFAQQTRPTFSTRQSRAASTAQRCISNRQHLLRHGQTQRSSPTRRARVAACRPVNFAGSRWGAAASRPAGFNCGGTIIPEDCNRMAQEFEKAFFGSSGNSSRVESRVPVAVDIGETDDAYLFTADLPGVQRADTKIQANRQDRMLTLSGERTAPSILEDQKDMRRRIERRFGKFSRSFKLPEDADIANVQAGYKDGVLTVTVARTKPAEPEVVNVNIDDWHSGSNET